MSLFVVASGCMHMDFSVNVFDIRRPYVPQATFDDQKDATSGMAWRDKDGEELITASKVNDNNAKKKGVNSYWGHPEMSYISGWRPVHALPQARSSPR